MTKWKVLVRSTIWNSFFFLFDLFVYFRSKRLDYFSIFSLLPMIRYDCAFNKKKCGMVYVHYIICWKFFFLSRKKNFTFWPRSISTLIYFLKSFFMFFFLLPSFIRFHFFFYRYPYFMDGIQSFCAYEFLFSCVTSRPENILQTSKSVRTLFFFLFKWSNNNRRNWNRWKLWKFEQELQSKLLFITLDRFSHRIWPMNLFTNWKCSTWISFM